MFNRDSQVKLDRLLRELASTAADRAAGGAVEARLRSACRARRTRRLQKRWSIGVLGLAACLLAVFGWMWRVPSKHSAARPVNNYAGFMALPYAQSDVPIEQAIIVRVKLGPADLKALGLPPALVIGRKPMRADLLIAQDGMARAVRLGE